MKKNNAANKTTNKPTKREVYAKYGIEFKNGNILSPFGWIKEVLKDGNDKTGKAVLTWSVLPGMGSYTVEINGKVYVIKGTCACNCVGCYAKTGHYHKICVIRSMAINTILANDYPEFLQNAISAQLEYIGRGEVRIHAAGDFNTKNPDEYAKLWSDIAEKFKSFRFWTYTKIKKFELLFDGIKNANIVKSVIPSVGVNFGHCEYIINAYYTLKTMGKSVYICKCGFDETQNCENCGVCASYDYVLFLEHSTKYKGKEDKLYPKLYDIVINQ